MTTLALTLDRVSYRLADGRALFSDLSFSFEPRLTALVGANGVGKSVLAQLLAGTLQPQQGRCGGGGRVHLLRALSGTPGGTLGELAGVGPVLAALQRIGEGSVDPRDFARAEGHWDLPERLARHWREAGLPAHLQAHDAASRLSGGQAMQVALSGAWASAADWLLLDEPSNHLDDAQHRLLQDQLAQWRGGLLLITHDHRLLERVHTLVELEAGGLHRYSGGHAAFAQARAARHAAAKAGLDHARQADRQQRRQAQEQVQRLQQRQARGARAAREANQAPILQGLQAGRAEATAGRLRSVQAERVAATAAQLRQAAAGVPSAPQLAALPPSLTQGPRQVAALRAVVLPHGLQAPLQLTLLRGQRLAVTGANGSGKSTLLRVLAGQLPPQAGTAQVNVPVALLDQQLLALPGEASVLQALQAAAPTTDAGVLRTHLALLGLDATRIQRAASTLSAGERLKGALACALHAEPAPGLLLLDEPGNGLDLAAREALEALLGQYRGTLVMTSHDPHLLQALGPSHRLHAGQAGWQLETCVQR